MSEPRDDEEPIDGAPIDEEPVDEERLRFAERIVDRTPIDWDSEAAGASLSPEETSGFRELERLVAAHARVAKEFDQINAPDAVLAAERVQLFKQGDRAQTLAVHRDGLALLETDFDVLGLSSCILRRFRQTEDICRRL